MTRVAFVGRHTYFEACALHSPLAGLDPVFIDHRRDADPTEMLEALGEADADVVVVFGPEIMPADALTGLRALTLGFLTAPASQPPDPAQFDRIVSLDASAAGSDGVWRALPLPVDDRIYGDPRESGSPPRLVFLGESTDHREEWLVALKHRFDLLHVVHGMSGAALRALLARTDVAINLHHGADRGFENRVLMHLAAGNLVLSEPLHPLHGLEPQIDFVEIRSAGELEQVVEELRATPGLFGSVRRRGRRKAEQFRASRIWPRLIADLQADVAAFGGRHG